MKIERAGFCLAMVGLSIAAILFAYGSAQRTLVVGDGVVYRYNPLTGFESLCRVQSRYDLRLECAYPETQRRVYSRIEARANNKKLTPEQRQAAGELMRRGLTPP